MPPDAQGIPLPQAAAERVSLSAALAQGGGNFRGAYVHVPFCRHKCHYCDFYSFVDGDGRADAYVDRALAEMAAWKPLVNGSLRTLFVGGGTPTMLAPAQLGKLLGGLRTSFHWDEGAEWTVEANPETVTPEIAATLRASGVTRVSMGAQSFQPRLLQALERHHDPASVVRAVQHLRAAGIEQVNVDLIYAIPGGTLEEWHDDLKQALALQPDHVSCYGLMYESNTPLGQRHAKGQVASAPEELEVAMHHAACEALGAAGFDHYEISNWSLPGRRCRHNELYWRNEDWLTVGPSASGHASGLRWRNVPRLGDWLADGPWAPVQDVERLNDDGQVGEAFMMGLRLIAGMPHDRVERLLARGTKGTVRRLAIARHTESGLLEHTPTALRLSSHGRLLASEVAIDLL
ncbi:MAG: radical SAM family heme chaperone HemW [Planctomycetaceae bacterium]|nr:radical SAM family heme chaperone HemW [Planctomycetaceae bacterium]